MAKQISLIEKEGRRLKMKKKSLNTDETKNNKRKSLAVNHKRFIYYRSFLKHLNKCMDQALKGPVNEAV